MTEALSRKVIVIGYGNPAREDDGLGPSVAEAIEKLEIDGVTVESDYQLNVEDSAAVAEHDVVIFVDASVSGSEPFCFSQLTPKVQDSFSSHSVEPEAVLGLAQELFNAGTQAYMLAVRGYSFDMFEENMTEKAIENQQKAVDFLASLLHAKSFDKCVCS